MGLQHCESTVTMRVPMYSCVQWRTDEGRRGRVAPDGTPEGGGIWADENRKIRKN